MDTRPEISKLSELRSKTDRQLAAFISSRLDVGLNYARLLADRESPADWTSVEAFRASAAKVYEEVQSLLPWVPDVTAVERRRLERKLEQLRNLFSQSSIHAGLRVQTACS